MINVFIIFINIQNNQTIAFLCVSSNIDIIKKCKKNI